MVAAMPDDRQSPPPPTEAALHQAAVAYLARYSATSATLARMLNRHIDRWARAGAGDDIAAQTAAAKRAVRDVVAKLAAAGAVDDAGFARARTRRLTRTGHSRRATAAHLAARGVPAEIVETALADDGARELAAAVAYVRRRRIGPFHAGEPDATDPERRRRDLAALARAGFARDAAERALALTRDAAEEMLARLRLP
jgi:regulatory protein